VTLDSQGSAVVPAEWISLEEPPILLWGRPGVPLTWDEQGVVQTPVTGDMSIRILGPEPAPRSVRVVLRGCRKTRDARPIASGAADGSCSAAWC